MKNLAIIPARGGSTRIPRKNIRLFHGKPLIAYTIEQAQQSKLFDRIIVDTDSSEIADISKKYGAEVPFLRPKHLAGTTSKVRDAVFHLLRRLAKEDYIPDIITLLQTTSPLREPQDIKACALMMRKPGISSVCTVCETSPWFYYVDADHTLSLVNKKNQKSTNTQESRRGYILNGCMVYMITTKEFLKTKKFVNQDTRAIICPKWRSVDVDTEEDWVLAEVLYANKKKINAKLAKN